MESMIDTADFEFGITVLGHGDHPKLSASANSATLALRGRFSDFACNLFSV